MNPYTTRIFLFEIKGFHEYIWVPREDTPDRRQNDPPPRVMFEYQASMSDTYIPKNILV
jgi:hypothetical protein